MPNELEQRSDVASVVAEEAILAAQTVRETAEQIQEESAAVPVLPPQPSGVWLPQGSVQRDIFMLGVGGLVGLLIAYLLKKREKESS